MLVIKKYNELSNKEIHAIFQARNEVFIVEQECVYQDIDGKDLDSYHCFDSDSKGNIIAYLRILKKGVSYNTAPSIGRVLVTKEYRRKGQASLIMQFAINFIFSTFQDDFILISAQEYLISFYSSLGFIIIGEGYFEDHIPHIQMKLQKEKS
jgi:ElaA protein